MRNIPFIPLLKSCKLELFIIILLGVLYFGSRVLYLDADIPRWKVSAHTSLDEAYYSVFAFEMAEGIPDQIKPYSYYDHLAPLTLLSQFTVLSTLSVFGDNYYGLRMSSVFAGAGCLAFLYLILRRRFGVLTAAAGVALLGSINGFVFATKYVAPNIYGILGFMFVSYLMTRNLNPEYWQPKRLLLLGMLSSLSVLLSYPTSLFFLAGAFLLICTLSFCSDQPKKWQPPLLFFTGAILGIILFFIFIYSTINVHWAEVNSAYIPKRMKEFYANFWYKFKYTFVNFYEEPVFFHDLFFADISMVSLSIFGLYGVSLLGWITKTKKQLTENQAIDLMMFSMLFFFILQMLITNRLPEQKLSYVLPLIIYAIALIATTLAASLENLQKYLGYAALAGLCYGFIWLVSVKGEETYIQLYDKPTYAHRDAMIGLKRYDHQIIMGGFSLAFRLYNDYDTGLNRYTSRGEKYDLLMQVASESLPKVRTIDYAIFTKDLAKKGYFPIEEVITFNDPAFARSKGYNLLLFEYRATESLPEAPQKENL